jgi:hypothetical protein
MRHLQGWQTLPQNNDIMAERTADSFKKKAQKEDGTSLSYALQFCSAEKKTKRVHYVGFSFFLR